MTVCPECEQGKHGNCDGTAWDDTTDAPTDCDWLPARVNVTTAGNDTPLAET